MALAERRRIMTRPDLDAIKARIEQFGVGKWDPINDFALSMMYIAHAREDIPALVAYIEALEAERAAWRKEGAE